MAVYSFNEASSTSVATITGASLMGGGVAATSGDIQTNGSGQAINTNDYSVTGLYKTGSNDSTVVLATTYTGGTSGGEYVCPAIMCDGTAQGYTAKLYQSGTSGSVFDRVQFEEDGSFFAAPFLSSSIDLSSGAVSLQLYTSGGDLILDIYQNASLHEQVNAGATVLSRTGSGFIIAYNATKQELLESWDDGLAADVTAPVLSSASGTTTGTTTASGSVSTDEGNGTLYYYASTNSSESSATIKASGDSQAVSGTGAQAVSFTGLTGNTTYYAHYVQDDSSANTSNVASSASFTTDPVGRSITDIDGDNNIQAGQTNITITTTSLDASPSTQTATLGGETLTVVSWSEDAVVVSAPLHIDLEWGSTTNQLALTDDTGTITFDNVTLSAPTGWESVTFAGTAPNASDTESFYEYAQSDVAVGSVTMAANDVLAWETQTGLSVDSQTIPTVDPAATVTGDYKIWDDSGSSWSSVSEFTITDGGAFSPTAPILSSPTGTKTGATTASGTVSTDVSNGTLYFYASANSSESAATIKSSGNTKAVTASGSQSVSVTGLTGATTYYLHYVHVDVALNDSNVVSSSSFTTDAVANPIITDTLLNAEDANSVIASETNLTVHVYNTDGGTELYSTSTATTDGSGVLVIDDDALGDVDDTVFVIIKRTNGQTACGTMTVVDGA